MEDLILLELTTLISIPSPSGDEAEILDYLESRLISWGYSTEHQIAGQHHNLVIPGKGVPFAISAHVDTVPPLDHPAPYHPRIEGGFVFGRGSADCKGGIAALLGALEKFARSRGANNLGPTVAFSVDEEEGGSGSEALASTLALEGAIVIEPTELCVGIAEAGLLEYAVKVPGVPAHGGAFDEGISAVKQAAKLISALETHPAFQRVHPLIGKGGFNVPYIAGGEKQLTVASWLELKLDVRILPGDDIPEIRQAVENELDRIGADWKLEDVSPPFQLTGKEAVVGLISSAYARALGSEPRVCGVKSWTDAQNFVEKGTPALVFGPGSLAGAHTREERVPIAELFQAARVFYELLLKTSAGGERYD